MTLQRTKSKRTSDGRDTVDAARVKHPVPASRLPFQHAIGNQAFSRLTQGGKIQAKLSLGPQNDPLEKEADRVAERVDHASTAAQPRTESPSKSKAPGGARTETPGGMPLDPGVRARVEPQVGADLTNVRVHTGSESVGMNQRLGSLAFTNKSDIYFGEGQYRPESSSGRRLIAHELAHVVQQGAATPVRATSPLSRAPAGVVQRQTATPEVDADRDKIIEVAQLTKTTLQSRAWQLGYLMLRRYFPEYSPNISGVAYDEKEPSARVEVKDNTVQGQKKQSATLTLGKAFVESISDKTLRDRILELGQALSKLTAIADPQSGPGTASVWKLIQQEFPKKGRRLAEVSYDANLPGLSTELTSGKVKTGGVEIAYSGPRLYFGKTFLAIPDEKDKVAKLDAEFVKVDKFAVENARLTKEDLDDQDIRTRIRGLSDLQLTTLRDSVKDPAVQAYAGSLLTRSTPLEGGLAAQPDGSATSIVGNIKVVVQPDTLNVADVASGAGDTGFAAAVGAIRYETMRGHITKITAAPPAITTVTIHTRFGPSANPSGTSGYGRGTTKQDKKLGATTLRLHEGSHGVDYLNFIAANPFPTFTGKVGMTEAAFRDAIRAYQAAANAWSARMKASSEHDTDCTGFTIQQYNTKNHIRSNVTCP